MIGGNFSASVAQHPSLSHHDPTFYLISKNINMNWAVTPDEKMFSHHVFTWTSHTSQLLTLKNDTHEDKDQHQNPSQSATQKHKTTLKMSFYNIYIYGKENLSVNQNHKEAKVSSCMFNNYWTYCLLSKLLNLIHGHTEIQTIQITKIQTVESFSFQSGHSVTHFFWFLVHIDCKVLYFVLKKKNKKISL